MRKKQRQITEWVIERLLLLCSLLSIFTTVGIIYVLFSETVGFFQQVHWTKFFFDTQWTPMFTQKHYGIWPLVAGTFLTTMIALLVAVPIGLISAIYISEYATPKTRNTIKPLLEILAAVPTVVYGYFALLFISPWLRSFIPGLSGFNALSVYC